MDNPYCLLPSLVKAENGYELSQDKGLAVMPVICNTCGYLFLFHPK
jgi:predicted Zn-ribbon and HTH transcriptional regulator